VYLDGDTVSLLDALGLTDSDEEVLGEMVGVWLAVALNDMDCVKLVLTDALAVSVEESVMLVVEDAVSVELGVLDALLPYEMDGVGLLEKLGVWESLGVRVDVSLIVGVTEGDVLGVGVGDASSRGSDTATPLRGV
jgi:hypothetical protein